MSMPLTVRLTRTCSGPCITKTEGGASAQRGPPILARNVNACIGSGVCPSITGISPSTDTGSIIARSIHPNSPLAVTRSQSALAVIPTTCTDAPASSWLMTPEFGSGWLYIGEAVRIGTIGESPIFKGASFRISASPMTSMVTT